MTFLDELKRRNVIRVSVAYIVTAWLIAQVAELVLDSFNAPDWIMQALLVVLALGLPLAIFFAWAFELTPEGIRKERDVDRSESIAPTTGRTIDKLIIGVLVLALGYFVVDKFVLTPGESATEAVDKSIAVLPFADFSPGGDQGWFADGLADEILNALARTSGLRVASRTSSFAYRDTDKDAVTIADELGVAHILEGSVRRAGDRIRVTAQLIRASDASQLWSETFDADSADSIEIQERIAYDIASLLDTAMDPAELRRMVAAGTESIAAWEAYVQMRELDLRITEEFDEGPDGAERLLDFYRQATREDPEFGDAHLLFARISYDWLSPGDFTYGPRGLSREAMQALLDEAAARASRFARDEKGKLGAEVIRARSQGRLADLVEYTRARLPYHPYEREVWSEHLSALIIASRFDEARAFVPEAVAHDFRNTDGLANIYAVITRMDLEAALTGVEEMLALPSPTPATFYQSHRILLQAGKVAEAADVGQRYLEGSNRPISELLVKIRQACAEGRVADADQIYADFDFSVMGPSSFNTQWLALQTLGRNDEAVEVLRPFDKPETVAWLAELLTYTHLDPGQLPNLNQLLNEQGAARREVVPISYACGR